MATTNMIHTIASQTIPHVQSIFNYYVNRYINTGDRILDTAAIGICTILFTGIIHYMSRCTELFQMLRSKWRDYFSKEITEAEFDPSLVNPTLYAVDAFYKYDFIYIIPDSKIEMFNTYAFQFKLITTNAIAVGDTFESGNIVLKPFTTGTGRYSSRHMDIQMPIARYTKDDKYEYIIAKGSALACDDIKELEKFVNTYLNPPNAVVKNQIYHYNGTNSLKSIGPVNKNKTFDSLYLDAKAKLIGLLEKFKTNTLYPPGLSLDNKLGIILHGPPGTGKTGACSAIANYLGRDIMLVSGLVTQNQNAIIDTIKQCQKTHVIVLDEFDYILNQSEKTKDSFEIVVDYTELLKNAETPKERDEIKKDIQNSQSKVSDEEFLLKLLDGFGDDSDRIIVATTNSIDKINTKYLRPGRFDSICLLGFCTRDMFRNLTVHVYENMDDLMDKHASHIDTVLVRNITPLILINALIQTDSFEELLDLLEKRPVQEYTYPEI